jgi:2OG-Fe(II) oxygenase superfamily
VSSAPPLPGRDPRQADSGRDATRFVRVYDGALGSAFCARMIESFDKLSAFQARNGRGQMKALEASAWTELNVTKTGDASLMRFFAEHTAEYLTRYNEDLRLTIEIPFRARMEDLRIKRYVVEESDRFQPHFDSLDYTSNRYLVFLWYLNDVADGGETEFPDLGLRIAARAGRLLMFPPYWMFQHAGLPPRSNDKYILSTYMLF